jgi:hypothetical protein
MRLVAFVCVAVTVAPLTAQSPDPTEQIAAAVLAAPEPLRDGAGVLGYDATGAVVTLRERANDLICLAAAPGAAPWSVACYHKSLEPYMARGRALRAEGVTSEGELNSIRWREMEEGTLEKPDPMAVLYVLHGDGFDAASGEVGNPFLRWVFYLPGATTGSTGLPAVPSGPGAPWLMFPGTQGAHIMVTPAQP